jgi:energy-coupling factor transporter transmembrane protein EcfT
VVEALLFWLFLLLILLVVVAVAVMQYVVVPAVVLRIFFRSTWVPRGLKDVVGWTLAVLGLLLVGAFGWSRHRQGQARHEAEVQRHLPPIQLTAQQPGLLPFRLGRGYIEEAHYDADRRLVVSGDLSVGGRLRARFAARPGFAAPNETDTVTVSTEDGAATQASGHSVYDPATRTVSGAFQCVLPSGRPLSVSFPPTPVARP